MAARKRVADDDATRPVRHRPARDVPAAGVTHSAAGAPAVAMTPTIAALSSKTALSGAGRETATTPPLRINVALPTNSPGRKFSPKAQRSPFSPALQRFLDNDPFELANEPAGQ